METSLSSSVQTDDFIDVLTTRLSNLSSGPEEKNGTKLSDLNNDCLFAVYTHLDLLSLANVADTCGRLRDAANEFFSRSKFRNLQFPLDVFTWSDIEMKPINALTQGWAKVLRNFGSKITHFRDVSGSHDKALWRERHNRFLETTLILLIKYCGDSLIELEICRLQFYSEFEILQQPIFPHLTLFKYNDCDYVSEYNSLPIWFPNLRELYVSNAGVDLREYEAYNFGAVRRQFDNLWKIKLDGIVTESCGKHLLECCPQVKHVDIVISHSRVKLLPHIFEYNREVEYLRIDFTNASLAVSHFDRFDRLKKLKHISIPEYCTKTSVAMQMIHRIVDSGIPIKSLTLHSRIGSSAPSADSLSNAIIKLKTLEKLELFASFFKSNHIQLLCDHLQLFELYVCSSSYMPMQALLDIIRAGSKLQKLILHGRGTMDMNFYERARAIIAERVDHKNLEIHTLTQMQIPNGWRKGSGDVFHYGDYKDEHIFLSL